MLKAALKYDGGSVSGLYYRRNPTYSINPNVPVANAWVVRRRTSPPIPPPSTCHPNADQVALYANTGYGGSCVTLNVGEYPNPGYLGPLGHDNVESVRVGANVQAILCEHDNYQGQCETFLGDDSNLGDNPIGANRVSSAKVQRRLPAPPPSCNPSAEQVALFVDANYGGQCVVKNIGEYTNPGSIGLPNDSISSIRVGTNVQAILCEHANYGGICETFTGADPNLSDNSIGNDRVSSMRVERKCALASVPATYRYCADEGAFCSFSGTANVIYGASSCYTSPRSFANGTMCTNEVFGDPIPGVRKQCYTDAYTPTPTRTPTPTPTSTPTPIPRPPTPTPTPGCVPSANGIVLYEHTYWMGRCYTFTVDHPDFNQINFNDIASSIRFAGSYVGRYEAILFEHTYYGGRSHRFTTDQADLNSIGFNDLASSLTIRRVEDTTAPTGDFTEPAPEARVSAPVWLRVQAQDNAGGSGMAKVRFTSNSTGQWQPIAEDSAPPYEVRWDMAGVPAGRRFMIGAELYDRAGNRRDVVRWITRQEGGSDTTAPTGDFTEPAPEARASAPVWLRVQAQDNAGGSGMAKVRFTSNGTGQWQPIAEDSAPPYEVRWDMAGVPAGRRFMVGAELYDRAGNRRDVVRWIMRAPADLPCNGDFEQGSGICWQEYSTHGWPIIIHADYLPVPPRSGSWAAWLGGEYDEISALWQQVTIPTDNPTLSFWYWIASSDECGYDFGGVIIDAITVVDVFDLCADTNTNGWVRRTVDLRAYASRSVELQIRAETDESLNSNLFVDDVALGTGNAVHGHEEDEEQIATPPSIAGPQTPKPTVDKPAKLPRVLRESGQHSWQRLWGTNAR